MTDGPVENAKNVTTMLTIAGIGVEVFHLPRRIAARIGRRVAAHTLLVRRPLEGNVRSSTRAVEMRASHQ